MGPQLDLYRIAYSGFLSLLSEYSLAPMTALRGSYPLSIRGVAILLNTPWKGPLLILRTLRGRASGQLE